MIIWHCTSNSSSKIRIIRKSVEKSKRVRGSFPHFIRIKAVFSHFFVNLELIEGKIFAENDLPEADKKNANNNNNNNNNNDNN